MWVYINDNTTQSAPMMGTSFQTTLNFLTDGTYNITVDYYNMTWTKTIFIKTTIPPLVDNSTMSATLVGNTVSISWAAPDNTGNSYIYILYRGTAPDFTITNGIKVGEFTTLVGIDPAALAPGTYYYKVIVEDLAGNQFPLS